MATIITFIDNFSSTEGSGGSKINKTSGPSSVSQLSESIRAKYTYIKVDNSSGLFNLTITSISAAGSRKTYYISKKEKRLYYVKKQHV